MKRLDFTCESTLEMGAEATGHHFTLRIIPRDDPAQIVDIDECTVCPAEHSALHFDGWGNLLWSGACGSPHDRFSYMVKGSAAVDAGKGRGTRCNPVYRYHSPLTAPGPQVEELLLDTEPADPASGPRALREHAERLARLVCDTMSYAPGSTDVTTGSEEALAKRGGVCQDYAHVLLSLLRGCGIAARYVCGFMLGEGATHAWVEYHDGETWRGYDPTNGCEAGDGYIALARGRDFSDCPMEQGIFQGSLDQRQTTRVSVEER